jgi:cellulose synthase/poly-beta-1,6-N-acetylglucosamine synthase-like glycosyltransferase
MGPCATRRGYSIAGSMSTISISVIVPARDAEATLPGLLAALGPQIAAREDAELIVVDSGSHDRTAELAVAAGARVLSAGRPGAPAARNAGLQSARGELIVFLDSDCIPALNWLEELIAGFRDAPSIGAVGGRIVAAPPTNLLQRYAEYAGYITQEEGLRDPFLPYLLTANCCYRKTALDRLDGFDEELRSGEDTDLAWRMQLRLGLEISYAREAMVEHVHRTTLRGLWRQWVRYGWGGVQLEELYPDRPVAVGGGGRSLTRPLRRLVSGLVALVELPFGRSDPLEVAAPVLRGVEIAAMHQGRWQARRARRPSAS